MTSYPSGVQAFLDDLGLMPDRSDRIQYLISVADRFQEVPAEVASRPFSENHRVPQCESEAYVWVAPCEGGNLQFHFAVENPQGISAKALAVILDRALSGRPASEAAELSTDLVYDLFGRELSMGKSLGLMGMVQLVRAFARRHVPTGTAP